MKARHPAGLALALLCSLSAWGQSVVLSGVLGDRALLSINGAPPRSLASGQTYQGVTVLGVRGHDAEIEVAGQRQTLHLGEGPVMAPEGAPDAPASRRIVLHSGSHGHFNSAGQINGRAVDFIVDTGATAVSLSQSQADQIGLNYRNGNQVMLNTANGPVPAWQTRLTRVKVGSVEIFDVDAIVSPAPMPYVLLGNSFLNRFQMTRTNDELVLEQRY